MTVDAHLVDAHTGGGEGPGVDFYCIVKGRRTPQKFVFCLSDCHVHSLILLNLDPKAWLD